MKQLALRDTETFKRGRAFEQEVARQMLLIGGWVIRQYDLNVDGQNKAPLMEGPFKGLRLPDLQCGWQSKTSWRECKEKGTSTHTYSQHVDDHGIGLRCYRDYLAVQDASGLPVYLMVGEVRTGLILVQSLEKLGPPRPYTGDKMDAGGMAFWHREQFDRWGFYDSMPGQMELFYDSPRRIRYAPGKLSVRSMA